MKNKKTKHSRAKLTSQNNQTTLDKLFSSSIIGLAITVGISLTVLLLGTAIAISLPDSLALVDPIGYVSLFISAFFGGFSCSKLNKRSPYIASMLCGCGFVLLSMLVSICIPHTLASGMDILTRLVLHTLSLAAFPIGALAGIKGSKNTLRKKRRK